MEMRNFIKMSLVASALTLAACDKTDRSFSILAGSSEFQQSATYEVRKIDILWVIDNSGSMDSSQTNLVNNFNSFINSFVTKGYDFRMAVQATDAFKGKFNGNNNLRRFKDGVGANRSGVYVMDKDTPNLESVFTTNARLGVNGDGDERAFSSFLDTLDYSANSDFRRHDAFLAIIIVSDEDDFSSTTATYLNNNYSSPNLVPVQSYVDFLNSITLGPQDYSVNAITVMDTACRDHLISLPGGGGSRVGIRNMDLVDRTNGVKGSLCSDFGPTLAEISRSIVKLASSFKLDREPVVSSILVKINGFVIANDSINGWTYDAVTRTVSFNGNSVPNEGDQVSITFDPTSLQ